MYMYKCMYSLVHGEQANIYMYIHLYMYTIHVHVAGIVQFIRTYYYNVCTCTVYMYVHVYSTCMYTVTEHFPGLP